MAKQLLSYYFYIVLAVVNLNKMKKNRYIVGEEDTNGKWSIRIRESNNLLFRGSLPECYAWIELMEKRCF